MGSLLNSLDTMLASAADNGVWARTYFGNMSAGTTAATTTSGYVTTQRMPQTIAAPSVGAGLTNAFLTYCRLITSTTNVVNMLALEYSLGTVTFASNTGTFSGSGTMPTKTVLGVSVTTASLIPILVATTALAGSTSSQITITYTNQAGTASRSAQLTIPNNPLVNSGFLISPQFQSGDTGVQSVSNIVSNNTITSGVLKVFGLLPLCIQGSGLVAACPNGPDPLSIAWPPFPIASTDTLAFYRFGNNVGNNDSVAVIAMLADN